MRPAASMAVDEDEEGDRDRLKDESADDPDQHHRCDIHGPGPSQFRVVPITTYFIQNSYEW